MGCELRFLTSVSAVFDNASNSAQHSEAAAFPCNQTWIEARQNSLRLFAPLSVHGPSHMHSTSPLLSCASAEYPPANHECAHELSKEKPDFRRERRTVALGSG